MPDDDVLQLAGIQMNKRGQPDNYSDIVSSDDLTRNWHARIAVKITAITLWPTIVMAFVAAYFLLNNIQSELLQQHKQVTALVAYEVASLWPRDENLTFHEKLEALRDTYPDHDMPGFELSHDGRIHKVGKLEIHESYYDTSLSSLLDEDIEIRTFFPDPSAETTSIRNQVLVVIFVALLFFAIFMNIATHIIIDKPLTGLVEATRTISKGNLSVRVDTSRSDEFGTMARFFNKMLDTLTKQKNLEQAARTDFLTGIANRRYFDETLVKELRRNTRTDSTLTLIMCDVDYFKQYNDMYNHVAGDLCLKHIANTLSRVFNRAGDLVARYGGEEFVVILPDTDTATGKMMAKLLREELAKLNLPHESSEVSEYVTLSIGVASARGSARGSTLETSPEELLGAADTALYRAKENGRNRIEVDMHEGEDNQEYTQPPDDDQTENG